MKLLSIWLVMAITLMSSNFWSLEQIRFDKRSGIIIYIHMHYKALQDSFVILENWCTVNIFIESYQTSTSTPVTTSTTSTSGDLSPLSQPSVSTITGAVKVINFRVYIHVCT